MSGPYINNHHHKTSSIITTINNYLLVLLPPQGFRPEAKTRGGTLVTRPYIKDSTYSSNIQ